MDSNGRVRVTRRALRIVSVLVALFLAAVPALLRATQPFARTAAQRAASHRVAEEPTAPTTVHAPARTVIRRAALVPQRANHLAYARWHLPLPDPPQISCRDALRGPPSLLRSI